VGVYRILQRLPAQGGLFEAWAATAADSERLVVLKRLEPQWASPGDGLVDRYASTVTGVRRLGNPRLPRLLDFGSAEGAYWLVTELVEEESLRALLSAGAKRDDHPPPGEVLGLVAQVAGLLATLHESSAPLVHGDVNCSTVRITTEGQVRLVDTGVARAVGHVLTLGPARSDGFAVAPELLTGRRASPSTDVFLLGLLAYEAIMGRRLFDALDATEALAQAQRFVGLGPAAFPGVPPALVELLVRMLAKDPMDRPHARLVESELRLVAKGLGASLTPAESVRLLEHFFPQRPTLALTVSTTVERVLELESSVTILPEPPPSAPRPPAPASAGVALGRIATRRITAEEVKAQSPHPTPAPPPTPSPASAQEPRREETLGDFLERKGYLTPAQLSRARTRAELENLPLAEVLVALRLLDEESIVTAMCELTHTTGMPAARLASMSAPPEVNKLLPEAEALALCAVPVAIKGENQLVVAMRDPLDESAIARVKRAAQGFSVIAVRASTRAIKDALDRFYRPATAAAAASLRPAVRPLGLSETQGRLLDGLLVMHGERGWAAQQLVTLACGVARRLGASPDSVDAVRFGAQTLVVAALVEGIAPGSVPTVGSVTSLLGAAWPQAAELLGSWMEGQDLTPEEPGALGLCAAFTFAKVAGTPQPKAVDIARALETFRTRYRFPASVHDALARELAFSQA
jgi:serine/threonine protein kinase